MHTGFTSCWLNQTSCAVKWESSLSFPVVCVCVCACIRIVSWWMLSLSWSVFLLRQQIDPPFYRLQLLLLCLSFFIHKSLLLASFITFSHFSFTPSHNFYFCLSLSSTFHPFPLLLISFFGCLFPHIPCIPPFSPSLLLHVFVSLVFFLTFSLFLPTLVFSAQPKVRKLMILQEKLHRRHRGNQ